MVAVERTTDEDDKYFTEEDSARVTPDMLIITEIPGLCTLSGNKGNFHASQFNKNSEIQKTAVLFKISEKQTRF